MSVSLKKTIGLRLLRFVFGCYFAIAIVVTSVQLALEYFHVKNSIFVELSNLSGTLESSLANSMWNYNIEQIQSTLDGTNNIALVVGTKVTDTNGEIFALNGITTEDKYNISIIKEDGDFGEGELREINYSKDNQVYTLYEYKFPLYFRENNNAQKKLLGYIFIYASNSLVVSRVQYGFMLIIINSVIKTFALWIIFLYATRRIIAIPLNNLAKAAQELNPNDSESFCKNNEIEKIFYSSHNDELHKLAESFFYMRKAIIEKIDVIEKQKLNLEHRVKERTAAVEAANKELKHLSLHDPLTDLPNRNLFQDRMENLLQMAKREEFSCAVASVDLRRFKEINDTFGHQAGDFVLQELSKRMRSSIRDVDTIARMGGDEFGLLLKGVDEVSVFSVGEKIIACANHPINFNGNIIFSGINVGFSIFPEHADNANELYKNADLAMYQAKKNDAGYTVFTPDINRKLQRCDVIAKDIKTAIDKEQMSVFYQPIISSPDRHVVAVEALLRWQHPALGFIPPDEFIPIAERSQVIQTITQWVLEQSLIDGEKLFLLGYDIKVSINLSGRLVGDSTFNKALEKFLLKHNFPSEKIILELTESSAMSDPEKAMDALADLKKLGVLLSIDDFGTGYSSFSYLCRLPVDALKIDRSFLNGFNHASQVVIESIIVLAHRLNLKVVVEGVETESILNAVESLGGDSVQGYYYSKPIPFDRFIEWLANYDEKSHID